MTLTACGGGSSGDGTTTTTEQVVTNTTPVANDGTATLVTGNSVDITLSANDNENDTLTYSINTNPTNGTVTLNNNVVSYQPNTEYVGSDSFTSIANDGMSDSNIATISIEVVATSKENTGQA